MAFSQNNERARERDRESDSREPGKEHSSYNGPILEEGSSGREVPVLFIGPEPSPERLYLHSVQEDPDIAQPDSSNDVQEVPDIVQPDSFNAETESEVFLQNRGDSFNSNNGKKMVRVE